MSIPNECPIWDKKAGEDNDRELTRILLNLMGFEHPVSTAKNIAVSLNLENHYRVRHWLYRDGRISAYEFLKILMKYERVRKYFGFQKVPRSRNPFLRMINRDKLQKKLLILCQEKPKISACEIGNQLSLSKKTVEYMIICLKKKHRLKRVGSARNGFWIVKGDEYEKENRYTPDKNGP